MPTRKPLLRDLAPDALPTLMTAAGEPAYRGGQLADWLFRRSAVAWDEMTNLPRKLRTSLAERYDLAGLAPVERQVSTGGTRKYLFHLADGHAIESVVIPMESHLTFCISSQVGCAMACSFCATARGGLVRNLSRGEIVEQALRLAADIDSEPVPGYGDRGYNIVFMGMGEPLDNYDEVAGAIETFTVEDGLGMSARRIQISTSGHADGLKRLLTLPQPVGLTLSVNGCTQELRRKLMPVPGRTPLKEILDLGERYARAKRRTVTIAYVMIDGVNDADDQALLLAKTAGRNRAVAWDASVTTGTRWRLIGVSERSE